jgi:hypothetical protein
MACALTTGFNLDCRDSNGGINTVYLATFSDADQFTEASAVITAVTLSPTRIFYQYEVRRYTSQATETITGSQENGTIFFDQLVEINLDKMETAKRTEILLLAQNYLYVIVKDNNGKNWWYGKTRGLMLNAGSGATGTAPGDRNGYNLQFGGQEPALAQEVAEAVIATIT